MLDFYAYIWYNFSKPNKNGGVYKSGTENTLLSI